MLPTPYVAWLRVYEPISAFDQVEQVRWSELDPNIPTGKQEQIRALTRIIRGEINSSGSDGAHMIIHKGVRYICPWSTSQRCWAALSEFKNSIPSSVLPMFLPSTPSVDDALEMNLSSSKFPHILSETWIIPPRWFALFSPEERLRGSGEDGPFTIMRTEISLAKERCLETHKAVKSAFGSGPVEQELVELLNWLNLFHPSSILECDYGGLATYLEKSLQDLGEDGLDADTSIEDVHSSIEGLAKGDGVQAGSGYERLVSRWRRVASFEQAM